MPDRSAPSDRIAGSAVRGDCTEARALLGRFIGGGMAPDDDRRMRRHLTSCPQCRTAYREALVAAASIGRALREQRLGEQRDRRLGATKRHARAVAKGRAGGRRYGLRAFVLTAALMAVLLRFGAAGNDTVVARALVPADPSYGSGEVRAAGTVLGGDQVEIELHAGEWCLTRGESEALLTAQPARTRIGPESQVLVELVAPLRLRLQQGSLVVHGEVGVSTPFGYVDVRGGARLALTTTELAVDCLEGEVLITHPTGILELAPGGAARAGLGTLSRGSR